jgi:hypothetical protein
LFRLHFGQLHFFGGFERWFGRVDWAQDATSRAKQHPRRRRLVLEP